MPQPCISTELDILTEQFQQPVSSNTVKQWESEFLLERRVGVWVGTSGKKRRGVVSLLIYYGKLDLVVALPFCSNQSHTLLTGTNTSTMIMSKEQDRHEDSALIQLIRSVLTLKPHPPARHHERRFCHKVGGEHGMPHYSSQQSAASRRTASSFASTGTSSPVWIQQQVTGFLHKARYPTQGRSPRSFSFSYQRIKSRMNDAEDMGLYYQLALVT